jgi:hypothetical protein
MAIINFHGYLLNFFAETLFFESDANVFYSFCKFTDLFTPVLWVCASRQQYFTAE